MIKESLDTSVEPCNDFFTFACGGFNSKAVIPDYKTGYSTFDVIRDEIEEQVGKKINGLQIEKKPVCLLLIRFFEKVRKLLSESILPSDPVPYKMAKTLFISCMDEESIEVELTLLQ